mgnify:CR=1 FL=1
METKPLEKESTTENKENKEEEKDFEGQSKVEQLYIFGGKIKGSGKIPEIKIKTSRSHK